MNHVTFYNMIVRLVMDNSFEGYFLLRYYIVHIQKIYFQHLNFECTDYIPINQPLTCFSIIPLCIQFFHSELLPLADTDLFSFPYSFAFLECFNNWTILCMVLDLAAFMVLKLNYVWWVVIHCMDLPVCVSVWRIYFESEERHQEKSVRYHYHRKHNSIWPR